MPSIGKDIPHDSARGHVSGESIFIDDMPPARNEIYVDVVGSPVAHGDIAWIDTSEARKIPGVVAIFTHEDVPGQNDIGPVLKDEQLLVSKTAQHIGQPILLVAAESRTALAAGRKAIKITMHEKRAILTIDEAIAQNSFLGPQRKIERGDVE